MGERYRRSQLLLEFEQHNRLRKIAENEERSISDVAREAIDLGLEVISSDEDSRSRRRSMALKSLDEIRARVYSVTGMYEGDLVAESRSDRERNHDRVRKGGG